MAERKTFPAHASSLTVVLTQALRSGDDKLLDYCLNTRNLRSIDVTVKHLHPSQILTFLSSLARKCQLLPLHCPVMIPWIQSAMRHHMAFLISAVDLLPCVASVHKVTEDRLLVYPKLLRLSGRLDFLVACRRGFRKKSGCN